MLKMSTVYDQDLILLLVDDKVSMLTHTYPHIHLRKIKVTICNHQADSPIYLYVASDI